MTQIVPYLFQDSEENFSHEVQSVLVNGEPWFLGKDAAESLDYENPLQAVRTHVSEEDKKTWEELIKISPELSQAINQHKRSLWINESGLYSLIFGSKKPRAKLFKRWVTSEVLPSIRKTGNYQTQGLTQDQLIEIVQKALSPVQGELIFVKTKLAEKDKRLDEVEKSQKVLRKFVQPARVIYSVRDEYPSLLLDYECLVQSKNKNYPIIKDKAGNIIDEIPLNWYVYALYNVYLKHLRGNFASMVSQKYQDLKHEMPKQKNIKIAFTNKKIKWTGLVYVYPQSFLPFINQKWQDFLDKYYGGKLPKKLKGLE